MVSVLQIRQRVPGDRGSLYPPHTYSKVHGKLHLRTIAVTTVYLVN